MDESFRDNLGEYRTRYTDDWFKANRMLVHWDNLAAVMVVVKAAIRAEESLVDVEDGLHMAEAELEISTMGFPPTEDDLTELRAAVAAAETAVAEAKSEEGRVCTLNHVAYDTTYQPHDHSVPLIIAALQPYAFVALSASIEATHNDPDIRLVRDDDDDDETSAPQTEEQRRWWLPSTRQVSRAEAHVAAGFNPFADASDSDSD
jgi:hypothetical protein